MPKNIRLFLLMFLSISGAFLSVAPLINLLPETAFALDDTEQEKKNKEQKEEFLKQFSDAGYGSSVEDYGTKLNGSPFLKGKDDSIAWYVQYLFSPGNYIEDVNNGDYLAEEESIYDKTIIKNRGGRKTVCYHSSEPQNLLNSNCDIPAIGTELFQNILSQMDETGVKGAGRTSSVAQFGFGVPLDIPGGEVPVDSASRAHKYTALELYGYDLNYTSYLGEWDQIQVSTEARMLSNIGFWGASKLAGKSIWNGVSNMLSTFFNGWYFSPTQWGKKPKGFIDGVVSTVLDSSDINVASMQAWKRPLFTNTLYNAHYLTDKEVIEKGQVDFFKYITDNLLNRASTKPEVKELLELSVDSSSWKQFVFNKKLYTEESKKARDTWNNCYSNFKKKNPKKKASEHDCGDKPDLVVVPEEEQFKRWKAEPAQQKKNAEGKAKGIDCFDSSDSYSALKSCWESKWSTYAKDLLNAQEGFLQEVLQDLENEFFTNNPLYDANTGISHYICADPEGKVDKSISEYTYVYTQQNSRTKEFVNPSCKPVRPSIKGGLFGNGETKALITDDTRYQIFLKSRSIPFASTSLSFWGKFGKGIAVFFAKTTNTIISLSFSNIFKFFGLDVLFERAIETFRDSVFYPLSVLAISASGIYYLTTVYKQGAGVFKSLLTILFTFVIGVIILSFPGKILLLVDAVPNKIDAFLADLALNNQSDSKLCTASGGANPNVRMIQCKVWEVTVFKPWVGAQWGTSYENLASSNLSNSNKNLVGDASVNMGGGVKEKNWALFQLEKTKIGSITTEDPTTIEGTTSREIYKLVDLQAGPKNGADSDSTYLATWSGMGQDNRNGYSIMSAIISVAVFLVVGLLGFLKFELTIAMAIKLLFLPFMFLMGLLPRGSIKLTQYISTLFSLMLKRIFVVLIMLFTLQVLGEIASSNVNYIQIGIFSVVFLIAVKLYYKELVNLLGYINNASDDGVSNVRQYLKAQNFLPRSVNMIYQQKKNAVVQGSSGAIGGAIAGAGQFLINRTQGIKPNSGNEVVKGLKKGWNVGSRRGEKVEFNRQRRLGFGVLQTIQNASQDAKRRIEEDYRLPDTRFRARISSLYSIIEHDLTLIKDRKFDLEKEISLIKATNYDDEGIEKLESELKEIKSKERAYEATIDRLNKITNFNSETKKWNVDSNQNITSILSHIGSKKYSTPSKDNNIFDTIDKFNPQEEAEKLVKNLYKEIEIEDNKEKSILETKAIEKLAYNDYNILNFQGIEKEFVKGEYKYYAKLVDEEGSTEIISLDELEEVPNDPTVKEKISQKIITIKSKVKERLNVVKPLTDYQRDLDAYYDQMMKYAKTINGDLSVSAIENMVDSAISGGNSVKNIKSLTVFNKHIKEIINEQIQLSYGDNRKSSFKDHKDKIGNFGNMTSTDKYFRMKIIEEVLRREGALEKLNLKKPKRSDYTVLGAKIQNESLERSQITPEEETVKTNLFKDEINNFYSNGLEELVSPEQEIENLYPNSDLEEETLNGETETPVDSPIKPDLPISSFAKDGLNDFYTNGLEEIIPPEQEIENLYNNSILEAEPKIETTSIKESILEKDEDSSKTTGESFKVALEKLDRDNNFISEKAESETETPKEELNDFYNNGLRDILPSQEELKSLDSNSELENSNENKTLVKENIPIDNSIEKENLAIKYKRDNLKEDLTTYSKLENLSDVDKVILKEDPIIELLSEKEVEPMTNDFTSSGSLKETEKIEELKSEVTIPASVNEMKKEFEVKTFKEALSEIRKQTEEVSQARNHNSVNPEKTEEKENESISNRGKVKKSISNESEDFNSNKLTEQIKESIKPALIKKEISLPELEEVSSLEIKPKEEGRKNNLRKIKKPFKDTSELALEEKILLNEESKTTSERESSSKKETTLLGRIKTNLDMRKEKKTKSIVKKSVLPELVPYEKMKDVLSTNSEKRIIQERIDFATKNKSKIDEEIKKIKKDKKK